MKLIIYSDRPALHGFKFFWCKQVTGYNTDYHCAKCLKGPYHPSFGNKMKTNTLFNLADGINYICGVSDPYVYDNNFHLPVEPWAGHTTKATYNGLTVYVSDSRPINIQPLHCGFRGLPDRFTTCRNFRFAIQQESQS